MNDEDNRLRELVRRAHEGETVPPFSALYGRAPRRRMYFAPLTLAAAALMAVVFFHRSMPPQKPAPTIELAALRIDSRGPLDFLLHLPGDAVLTSTPRFDTNGDWP